jgi:AcrR family transcriptional regulator
LTKTEVAQHQRARILSAMAQVVAAKGYPDTTVADVIAAAGVSRATFYQQFDDKHDCFLAAFDAASEQVLRALHPAVPRTVHPDAFVAMIGAYLEALTSDVASARVFLVDIYAAGSEGIARRAAGQRRFTEAVSSIFGARSAADRFAVEALVAAVGALVTARIAAGDVDGLRQLAEPLAGLAKRMFA